MKKKALMIEELKRFRQFDDINDYCRESLDVDVSKGIGLKKSRELDKAIKKLKVKKLRELHSCCEKMWDSRL